MNANVPDVIIVGGGPAGSATAWALARAGLDVRVLDRAQFPRSKPCAEYLNPAAVDALRTIGVLPAVIAAGATPIHGMRVIAANGTALIGEFAGVAQRRTESAHGLALRRERLDALLLDAARVAGATVRERTHVIDLVAGDNARITGVRLADGTIERAKLIIGADGLRSVVARRLHLGGHARWPRRMAFVAHYEGVRGMGSHGEMHVYANGYVGLAPVDAGLVNVAVVVPTRLARPAAGDAARFLESWLALRPRLVPRFVGARRVDNARGIGPFAWSTRRAWAPGVALVGDAVEFFDPFTGEGMCSALRGGLMLAPHAQRACGAEREQDERAALAAYDDERHRAFRGKWAVERLVGAAVAWPPFLNRAARGLARRRDLADTFVGVTGEIIPATSVLHPAYAVALARAAFT